ncbi:MAG: hypothetical protein ACYC64_14560 [Armatimonadota bacterium]
MRIFMWIVLFVAAVTYAVIAFATVDRRDDDAQITSMIRSTVSSIQKRDLSGTISCVSKDYKDSSGMNYDRLRLLTAQALRVENNYTADAQTKRIDVKGDTALVDLHFAVRAVNGGRPMYERDLMLHLNKEDGRHAWIIPIKIWRVTEVDGLALKMEDGL